MENVEIGGHLFELFLNHRQIEHRIRDMAHRFNQNMHTGITMVPVMAGAFYFAGSFLGHITRPYRLMGVQASSYEGVNQADNVHLAILKEDTMVEGAHLVILEDIIDSGRTAHRLENRLYELGANKVEVLSLFYKPDQLRFECNLSMYGFEAGPEFLVGYGLDVDEEGRYLKDVYRLVGNK